VGLTAVALAESMRTRSLSPQIKWPNDILLADQKVAGILVESVWSGEAVDCVVIGVGINVMHMAVPPREVLQFPATSLEAELGSLPKREAVLHDVLSAFLTWRPYLGNNKLIKAWDARLAFRGQQVQVTSRGGRTTNGTLLGLEADGSLRLQVDNGNPMTVRFGDVRLRPAA
jgi:BirA family biotin operon repressor/biotin-[acetyl-CoA-carboxylase] ligase